MPCKDYLRIVSLGAAITLGLLVHSGEHSSAPQADSWAGPIEMIRPVSVERVSLPATPVFNT
ncbi:hypothetical protein N6L27_04845 [Leisingera sp. SS27]|uniref:hypothetical protein n=1 Tax=Leisingera sp. SS27 TaxID=2979462 RepID=UPI00232B376D|nr:hypothetical protein [Leisingera sp. SS27]MDC0657321.1 hypothetical protein [Leisingera sp. SS27]